MKFSLYSCQDVWQLQLLEQGASTSYSSAFFGCNLNYLSKSILITGTNFNFSVLMLKYNNTIHLI